MWQYKMLVRLGNLHASRILLNCRCNLLPGSLPCRSTQQVSNEVTNIPTGVCRSGSRQDSHSMNFSILVFYLTLTWSYLPSTTYSTKVPPDTTNNNASAANSQNESAQNISVDECTCQDLDDPTAEVDESIHDREVQQYALETLTEDSDNHEVGATHGPIQADAPQISLQSSSHDVSLHRGATGYSITTDHGLNECLEAYSPRTQRRSARSDSTSHHRAVRGEIEANETTDYTCPSAVQGNAANPRSIQMLAEFQLETLQREVQDGSRSHGQGLADVKVEANETNESIWRNTFLTNTTNTFSNQQFGSQGVSENELESHDHELARVNMEASDAAEVICTGRVLPNTNDVCSNQHINRQSDAQNDSQSRSQGMVRLKTEVNQGLRGVFERPQPDLNTTTNTSSPQCIDSKGTTQNNAQCRGHGIARVKVKPAATTEVSWTRPVRHSVPDHYLNKGNVVNQGTSHRGPSRNDHMRVQSESNQNQAQFVTSLMDTHLLPNRQPVNFNSEFRTRNVAQVSPYNRATNPTRQAQVGTCRIEAHLRPNRDPVNVNSKFKTRKVARVSPYHSATNPCLNRKGDVHRVAASERAAHNDWNAHGQRPVEVRMEDNQIRQGRYHHDNTWNPRVDLGRPDQAESPREHLGHAPVCVPNHAANEDEALARPAYAQDSVRDFGAVTKGAGGVVNRNTGSREILVSFSLRRDEGITRTCPNRHGMSTGHTNLPRDDPQPLLQYECFSYVGSEFQLEVLPRQGPGPRHYRRLMHLNRIFRMNPSFPGMMDRDRMRFGFLWYRSRIFGSTGILLNEQVATALSEQYHLRSTPIWGTCTRCRIGAMVRHYLYDGSSHMICVTCQQYFENYIRESEVLAGNPPSTLGENLPQLPPTTAYSDNNAVARNSQTLLTRRAIFTHRDNGNSSRSRPSSRDRNVDQENSQRPTSNVDIRNSNNSCDPYSRRAP